MSEPTTRVEALRETCPKPDKHRYLNESTALVQAARLVRRRSAKGALYPYLCRCGFWHLTSRGAA